MVARPNPYSNENNAYETTINEVYPQDEQYELFNLSLPDERLIQMLVNSLDKDISYWNQAPWNLQKTDLENVKFFLGDQLSDKENLRYDTSYVDNRLFESVRAILSYATGQLGKPEIIPSKSDPLNLKMARSIEAALYQHSADEKVDQKFRAAVLNLLLRKRSYIKLRFDPNKGMYGDVVTEVCSPEDIIIDRNAKFMDNPNVIYHRITCTVDELCAKFPKKANEIRTIFQIKQGRFTQMSRIVTYFEAWFTYMDAKNLPREGVAWFIHDPQQLILDKMPNPNWIYTGDDKKDKQTNVLFTAPKPFVAFNYLNLGHSYIDETTLFDQAKPLQRLLNKRLRQINENADYVNGRWVASSGAMNQEDAEKFINKGSKTLLLAKTEDVNKSIAVIAPQQYPAWAYQTLEDTRNEIDGIMGTPAIFKGNNPDNQDTLGRDLLLKQQAGMLQDDLVNCVQAAYGTYYSYKLQMMRVYYTDDYWFQVKGGDGKFDFIMLNGDTLDANVKISVQTDSTLPLDKASIQATATALAKMNRIDTMTLYEDLGLPDPDLRAERFMMSQLNPMDYMSSIEQGIDSNDAEVDIMLLIANRDPQERDDYDEDYLNYFNEFLTTNKFRLLPPQIQKNMTDFLHIIANKAAASAQLKGTTTNDAGMIEGAPLPPPRPTISIRANTSPQEADQLASNAEGIKPPQPPVAPPMTPGGVQQPTQPPAPQIQK